MVRLIQFVWFNSFNSICLIGLWLFAWISFVGLLVEFVVWRFCMALFGSSCVCVCACVCVCVRG